MLGGLWLPLAGRLLRLLQRTGPREWTSENGRLQPRPAEGTFFLGLEENVPAGAPLAVALRDDPRLLPLCFHVGEGQRERKKFFYDWTLITNIDRTPH